MQQAALALLEPLARTPRLGLITDFDGTLSPIVPHPDLAQIVPRIRDLLLALQPHLAVLAVVSGRGVADVVARANLPGAVFIGNHGLEWWADGHNVIAPEADPYRPALEAAIATIRARQVPGMLIEDKLATVSIHYRLTANPEAVEALLGPVIQQIATQHGLAVFEGRKVFELRPPVAINKGTVLAQLVRQYALEAALFIGDDTTDADALAMARLLRRESRCYAVGLGVASAHTPPAVREQADWMLADLQEVESVLDWLLNARRASST